MRTLNAISLTAVLLCAGSALGADPDGLQIFGYAQNSFYHIDNDPHGASDDDVEVESLAQSEDNPDRRENSFQLQQLNLFLKKQLSPSWTSFISLEMVNSYSSFRDWGAFNLEEAWLRYRLSKELNLKLGLQIPTFNNFNEIKNRTPLMPYVVRPLIYETSFQEIIPLEMFAPERAFV